MRSLLLEFHRFNDLKTGLWREGDPYLVATGSDDPVREFTSPLGQDEFLDLIVALRYQADAQARVEALRKVGDVAADLLGTNSLKAIGIGPFPLQLDLVLNPAELAALPFEAATDNEGRPLFTRSERAVVPTRRVRHDFAETSMRWPVRPRILFAWASPPGAGEVPFHHHEAALRGALEPWIPIEEGTGAGTDSGNWLMTLAKASLSALEAACQAAVVEKKPFTHVHLLAHGYPVGVAHRQHFGIALHAEDGDLHAVSPEELARALVPLVRHPVVVTLASCDSANLTHTTTLKRSIAHELHVAGFPIVVASQLPFTVPGSNLMVETFYTALLGGRDVREALHETRLGLYEFRTKSGHDWASLVGYVRLPEGYADHLEDVRLERVLALLKTVQGWSDRLVKQGNTDTALFDRVGKQLQARIAELERFLKEAENTGRRGVLEENLGLLGSAEKRLAELCFVRGGLGEAARWQQSMRAALERSRNWYGKAYEHNLSHHWTGVQYLSLEAVLEGRIANPGRWHAALTAAEIDRGNPKPTDAIWALGSLSELYLLAPLAGQRPPAESARNALAEMKMLLGALEEGDTFPLESTERQFRRYVNWWTAANGFFPGRSDLAAEAGQLAEELRR